MTLKTVLMMASLVLFAGMSLMGTGCGTSASVVRTNEHNTAELLRAAERGNRPMMARLMDRQGTDVDSRDDNGRTALHMAAMNGHNESVKLLLSRGADANAVDDEGNAPLHFAAMGDHEDTCRQLLLGGADRSTRNREGKIPADLADEDLRSVISP